MVSHRESENLTHGEVDSAPSGSLQHQDENPKTIHTLSSLGRQSSIYSLTLDEFQHTLCENGKNFGSMNMDEFLSNIWTAEENQVVQSSNGNNNNEPSSTLLPSNQNEPTIKTHHLKSHPSLPRQGSITLPAPLCRKTVEEVWSEIHRDQQQRGNNVGNPVTTDRQPTFGEMTLEDFLVRAGVVREAIGSSSQNQSQPSALPHAAIATPSPGPPQYGVYPGNNAGVNSAYGIAPVMSLGFPDHHQSAGNGIPAYQGYPHAGAVVGEPPNYAGKRNGGYPPGGGGGGVSFGGRVGNGGGYVASAQMGSPPSPGSSDGMGGNQVDNTGNQYGLEMGGMRGRKRIIDGPVEKVVERRQRRMIKNRESAARSRARKQAYTVELEAELNQLKEENARLKRSLAEAMKKRRQEMEEEMKQKAPSKADKTIDKLRMLRRTSSS